MEERSDVTWGGEAEESRKIEESAERQGGALREAV